MPLSAASLVMPALAMASMVFQASAEPSLSAPASNTS